MKLTRRSAGVSVPLFSVRSSQSWGIGEIGDIPALATWLQSAHQTILQLLPLNELAPDEQSPYSGLSAMAIDPQFISVRLLEDFTGESALGDEGRQAIRDAKTTSAIDYRAVRALKARALSAAFDRFWELEWLPRSPRAAALSAFIAAEAWWLDDYSLYRALRRRADEQPWTRWEPSLQRRDPMALAAARRDLSREILFRQYLQWVAQEQWRTIRREAADVAIFGDFPFMVALDSADVWARQEEFLLDASVGTPPDAFSSDGQNWGLPPYRWETSGQRDFEWLRLRARRCADLFDGFRIDHLVGFYRTYIRPLDRRAPYFDPGDEGSQRALGERLLPMFARTGVTIMVEDLGSVPDFVRASVARSGIPGYRVLRWERHHHLPGQPFIDPVDYPAASVATTGTHDTETLAVWWDAQPSEVRRAVAEVPSICVRRPYLGSEFFSPAVRDALLEAMYASGSDLLILPVQDVFGWRDRINQPATVSPLNWTYVLPWPVDLMTSAPDAVERAATLRSWTDRYRPTDRQ